jgi:hypothetical protein
MKNPARFPGWAFSVPVKDICLCLNPVSLSKVFSGELFFTAAFDGKTISKLLLYKKITAGFAQVEADVVMAGTGTPPRWRSGDPVARPSTPWLSRERRGCAGQAPRMTWIQTSETSYNRNDRVQNKFQTKCLVRI